MFKQFFWKIVLCIIPVLLASLVITGAMSREMNQTDKIGDIELPRFKLGVDLVGGTILVYEIDTRKLIQEGGKEAQDPKQIANNLAEKLKNRIDPNDLYNVVIRPAGGEGRVEIILPTGGVANAEKAQKDWDELLRKMEKEYNLPDKSLRIPRGQVQKLTDRILLTVQQRRWESQLYREAKDKQELLKQAVALDKEKQLTPFFEKYIREQRVKADVYARTALGSFGVAAGAAGSLELTSLIEATMVERSKVTGDEHIRGLNNKNQIDEVRGQYANENLDKVLDELARSESLKRFDTSKSLGDLMEQVKRYIDDNRKTREIDAWFKQQAWRKMIGKLLDKYFNLPPEKPEKMSAEEYAALQVKARKSSYDKIAPDAVEELVGRIACKGDSISQSFLTVAEPLVGNTILEGDTVTTPEQLAKDPNKFYDPGEVLKDIRTLYGPAAAEIEKKIEAVYRPGGRSRDLTVEEVQRIKELVSKVGSLEFRILANSVDDAEAIKDAAQMLNTADSNPQLKAELDDDQNNGLPPPAPRNAGTKEPKRYYIKLHGDTEAKTIVTYSWVELGPQERQQLGLHNAALTETRGLAWTELAAHRKQAVKIPYFGESGDKFMLQGALFYSRECQDRNLPEEERRRKKYEYFVLTRSPEIDPQTGVETPKIDGSYLRKAYNQADNTGRPAASFVFNETGGALFGNLTRKNIPTGEEGGTQIKRHLAIILDGLIMSAPTINSQITTHGQISGSFTNKEVDNLVNILNAGALPATLKPQPVSENTMGATLGQDTINKGLVAIMVAFAVVLLFMIVYYRFAGLVASIALLANLILTVGFMVAVKATFTLPGLAGLVLMLGMAVDANILIYERLREERERGASILLALRNGYDRAFWVIIDTHLTSIFTGIVLYIVGNDQLKGFGVTLVVGLLISLFTSLYMTRLMFDLWASMGWLKKLSMFRFFSRPDIDFMSIRYYLFAATGILTILGGALFIGRLPNDLNIDFVGGTAYSGQLTQAKTIEELRGLLSEESQKARLRDRLTSVEEIENTTRYTLTYDDGGKKYVREVVLANKPDFPNKKDREDDVKRRAGVLPDWAVEQIFLSSDEHAVADKSRFFTVRTTEKEPDLVQATLDRLLQTEVAKGQWEPLLQQVVMEFESNTQPLKKDGREVRVRFYDYEVSKDSKEKKKVPTTASPSFVSTLLGRQLVDAFHVKDRAQLPFTVELASDDEDPLGDGRFRKAEISFLAKGASLSESDIARINQALLKTKAEFEARPQPERLETFDSQLAAETRLRAMYAILLSWAAILGYLWLRFGSWTFGLAAVLCLIHDLFFTLGAIAICHYVNALIPGLSSMVGIEDFKIDLAAVAALLTLVGYSVNDTIVVFDRIREVRGKNPDLTPQMINDSVNQTLSRTLLSSLTTWLVVIVLYFFGGPGVHLFAFVMVVGVVVGTYSSIYVASPLLLLFGEGARATAKARGFVAAPAAETGPDTRVQPAR
jgi:SecD/SecF fusion protein